MTRIAKYINTANYDGSDIARPYIVDNTNGTPVYTYVDVEDYYPPLQSKRAATALWDRLWPQGIVLYNLSSSFSGMYCM